LIIHSSIYIECDSAVFDCFTHQTLADILIVIEKFHTVTPHLTGAAAGSGRTFHKLFCVCINCHIQLSLGLWVWLYWYSYW